VIDFRYSVLQLNRLDWRSYVMQPNPMASALMARMKITVIDRPYVKLECLRLLATLHLNPAKARLIAGFVESYLKLSKPEMRISERELDKFPQEQKEETMEVLSYWEQKGLDEGRKKGLKEGRHEGKIKFASRLLLHKFGTEAASLQNRLQKLSPSDLDRFGETILDFATLEQAQDWLNTSDAR